MTTATTLTGNKKTAVDFLHLVVAGQIQEGYRKHVDMSGKHHNPFFPAGFPSLQQAMIENDTQFPDKKITVHHVLGDGDLVAVHSRVVLKEREQEFAAVHLFRFSAGKIVEMWDIAQALPSNSPNNDGIF